MPKGGLISVLVTIGGRHSGAAAHISFRIFTMTGSNWSTGTVSAFVIIA